MDRDRGHHQAIGLSPNHSNENRPFEDGSQNQLHSRAQEPGAENGTWEVGDVEEEHLLSYFFNEDHIDSSNGLSLSPGVSASSLGQVVMHGSAYGSTSSFGNTNLDESDHSAATRNTRNHCNDSAVAGNGSGHHISFAADSFGMHGRARLDPPSTPAVHFYAGSSSSKSSALTSQSNNSESHPPMQPQPLHHPQTIFQPLSSSSGAHSAITRVPSRVMSSSSSSSSSLSSIAAALVSGGGPASVMQVHHHLQAQAKETPPPPPNHTSPISPAAIIGMGQETMMLPPPPRFPSQQQHLFSDAAMQNTTIQGQQPSQSQHSSSLTSTQHMEWLQQMNNLAAMASRQASVLSHGGSILSQQQQVQQLQHQTHHAFSSPYQPGYFPSHMQHQPQQSALANNAQTAMTFIPQPTSLRNTDILPSGPFGAMNSLIHQPGGGHDGSDSAVPKESAERRARRLARNRESARQSRRRKKELLIKLETKVNKLQSEIETERRRQLMCMETDLPNDREKEIKLLMSQKSQLIEKTGSEAVEDISERLAMLVQNGGPNCASRRAGAIFQYNTVRQTIVPYSQQFLLWMLLKQETFFTTARDQRAKTNKGTGRISSKQVGEEIMASQKSAAKSSSSSDDKSAAASRQIPRGPKAGAVAVPDASEEHQVWPLLCYELGVSFEQEERLIQAYKRLADDKTMPSNRSQLAISDTTVTNLKNGILFQAHSAAHRNEFALLHVLTPHQATVFLQWFIANKERCRKLLKPQNDDVRQSKADDTNHAKSLNDICKQLTEILKIPKNDNYDLL